MSSFTPLVSIVIPVYNGSDYLKEAIDSALAQTYPAVEVLVINDGSKDEGKTDAIARSYGDKIRYFAKENGGVATALNQGIDEMRGEYFSWLSHDDVYYPEKVAVQVEFLRAREDRNVVLYGDFIQIDQHSNFYLDSPGLQAGPATFVYQLIVSHPIHGCTTLIPKAAFARAGRFDPGLRTTQDYDLWYRMARHYPFLYVDHKLIKSRIHAGQGTVTLSELCLREGNELLIRQIGDFSPDSVAALQPAGDVAALYRDMAVRVGAKGFGQAAAYAAKIANYHHARALLGEVFEGLRGYGVSSVCVVTYRDDYGLAQLEPAFGPGFNAYHSRVLEGQPGGMESLDLPGCQAVVCANCFTYLSYKDSIALLKKCKDAGVKYLLASDYNVASANADHRTGKWRPVHLEQWPFAFPRPLFTWNGPREERGEIHESLAGNVALWEMEKVSPAKIVFNLRISALKRKVKNVIG
jgi:hypothetical protein